MAEISRFNSLVDAISFRRQRDPQGQACVFLSGNGDAKTVSNEQFYHDMPIDNTGFRVALRLHGMTKLVVLCSYAKLSLHLIGKVSVKW